MNVIIIDNPHQAGKPTASAPGKFQSMIEALSYAGIPAIYQAPDTKSELLQIIDKNPGALFFCSVYDIKNHNNSPNIVHGILDDYKIPYVGSPQDILKLVLNKPRLKSLWMENGIKTPEWISVKKTQFHDRNVEDLLKKFSNFPCIVKPACAGNSRGIGLNSVVFHREELIGITKMTCQQFGEAIIEEYLGGADDFQEYTVAWVGNHNASLIMPSRINLSEKRTIPVITNNDKDLHLTNTEQIENDDEWRKAVLFARKAFDVSGIRDYARLDFIRSRGQFYAIEINGQPMVPDRWFEACANGAGMNQAQYINAIFMTTIIRINREGFGWFHIPMKMHKAIPRVVQSILSSPL